MIDCNSEEIWDHLNALYMFLDFQLNRFIFGGAGILLGVMFLCINYKGNVKRTRYVIVCVTCIILGVSSLQLPFYLTKYKKDFDLGQGWFLVSMGLLLGLFLFVVAIKVQIYVFT